MADSGGILQCPLLCHMSGPVRKGGIKMLSLQNFFFIWKPMARGTFSLWELVRHAYFENSTMVCRFRTWCDWVSCYLGFFRGFVPINRGLGPHVDTFHSTPSLPSASKDASEKD